MTVKVLALVSVNEDDPQALAQYFDVTTPLMQRAGAQIVQRFTMQAPVVGTALAQMMILVDYPDEAAVRAVFDSPEYLALRPVRDRAFRTYQISIVDGQPALS